MFQVYILLSYSKQLVGPSTKVVYIFREIKIYNCFADLKNMYILQTYIYNIFCFISIMFYITQNNFPIVSPNKWKWKSIKIREEPRKQHNF